MTYLAKPRQVQGVQPATEISGAQRSADNDAEQLLLWENNRGEPDAGNHPVLTPARLRQMLANARHAGKSLPNPAQLLAAVRDDCYICHVRFTAIGGPKRSTPSLQHELDGTYSIICCQCNTRHGSLLDPADVHLRPQGLHRCPACQHIKPLTAFYFQRTSPTRCKACHKLATTNWKRAHPNRARAHNRRSDARQRLRRLSAHLELRAYLLDALDAQQLSTEPHRPTGCRAASPPA